MVFPRRLQQCYSAALKRGEERSQQYTEDRQLDKNHDQREEEFRKDVETVLAAERRNRIRWAIIGLLMLLGSVGLFVLFAEYRVFFFRPKPDMKEVERVAFKKTNDPVCRELLAKVDAIKDSWRSEQLSMKDLYEKGSAAEVAKGRARLQQMIGAYEIEKQRRVLMIPKEDRVHAELSAYFKHVLFYLRQMDDLLAQKQGPPPAEPVADAGGGDADADADSDADAGVKKEAPAGERYIRAWRLVTEDHDKWRVYRQGPVPCGQRRGPTPAFNPTSASETSADAGPPAATD